MSIRPTHLTDEDQFHALWVKLRELMKRDRHLMHGDKVQTVIDAISRKKSHPFISHFEQALESVKGRITPIVIRKAVMCEEVQTKKLEECFVGKGLVSTVSFPYQWTTDEQNGEEAGPYTVLQVGDYCQFADLMEDLLGTKTVVNAEGSNVWARFLRSAGYVTSLARVERFALDHLNGKESELCTEHTNCFFVSGVNNHVLITELIYRPGESPYWELEVSLLTNSHYVKDRGAKARVFIRGDHTVARSFDAATN